MAKVRFSSLVDSISGKVGSTIFSNWKGKPYIRSIPVVLHNPSTAAQGAVRNSLQAVTFGWRALTDVNKLLWKEYAQGLASNEAPIGDNQLIRTRGNIMSGFNAYSSANLRLAQLGLPLVNYPPSTIPPTVFVQETDKMMGSYFFNLETFPGAEDSDRVRMHVRTNWSGGHTYIYDIQDFGPGGAPDGVGTMTMLLDELRIGHEGTIDVSNMLILFGRTFSVQFDVLRENGAISSPSEVITITIDGNLAGPIAANILSIWGDVSVGFKGNLATYATTLYAGGYDSQIATIEEASFYHFSKFLIWFKEQEPAIDLASVTKSGLETAGFPLTIAELGAAGALDVIPGGDLTGLTSEW